MDYSGRRFIILLLDYKSIMCEMKDHNLHKSKLLNIQSFTFFFFFLDLFKVENLS